MLVLGILFFPPTCVYWIMMPPETDCVIFFMSWSENTYSNKRLFIWRAGGWRQQTMSERGWVYRRSPLGPLGHMKEDPERRSINLTTTASSVCFATWIIKAYRTKIKIILVQHKELQMWCYIGRPTYAAK